MLCHICCAIYAVQYMRCNKRRAIYMVQHTLCNLRGAIYAVQPTWCNLCGALHVVQPTWCNFLYARSQLPTPLLAQSSHPRTRNLVCKTHVTASAMSAWRWLVHLCGRASPRMLARAAAS
eukprot:4656627-Pyramimonas_sp.AAC.1